MAGELIIDAWTALSYKQAVGQRSVPYQSGLSPTWVGDHQRRLTAYKVLQSYIDNSARVFLNTDSEDVRGSHREYGDPALIVNQVLAALLGEDQTLVVEGADEYDTAAGAENSTLATQAFQLQTWLEDWAKTERLPLKMVESERNAIGLGDGVYVLGWSAEKQRPRLRVFDPGFYFPVLDDGNEDDFPSRVHIAWETDDPEHPNDPSKVLLRRLTWELRDLPEGQTRTYPWDDRPSRQTCYMTDATWHLDAGARQTIDDLSGGRATYADYTLDDGTVVPWRDIDLEIDFVPVVHVPNTVSLLNHYGRSSLSTILQILDDLSNADTDLQAASATTGTPPIALSGATLGEQRPTYRPGEIFELGESGRMDVLDTSRSLDALITYVQFLLKRLSVNARLPEAVIGRVAPSEVPSGVALALSFGPLESMVKEMRLVRAEKYPLLLKFAWRIASQAEGTPADYFPATIEFGSFLPSDTSAVISEVTDLLQAKAVSLETAVRILMAAGLPIDEASEEVQRIQSRDFVGAGQMRDATDDDQEVRDYLGLQGPPPQPPAPPPAPIVTPPVPQGAPGAPPGGPTPVRPPESPGAPT